MRILLTSTASYVPPRGGSTRSNRIWLEHLAAHGHACRVVCGTAPAFATDPSRVDSDLELDDALLAEIEGLSDEEAEMLLREESTS